MGQTVKTIAAVLLGLLLSACSHSRLTGYNLKASVGHTDYQDGQSTVYTGAGIDAHFDYK